MWFNYWRKQTQPYKKRWIRIYLWSYSRGYDDEVSESGVRIAGNCEYFS